MKKMLAGLFGFILAVLAVACDSNPFSEKGFRGLINCDIHNRSCVQNLSATSVTLDITPRPVKAMERLLFRIKIEGQPPTSFPYIDLSMPGMDMGPNQVRLHTVTPGIYEGKGLIVRCKSGMNVWKATLTIPEQGTLEYIFDVVH